MIHLLDVECSDCGAKVNEPCKRSLTPHQARYRERNRQRVAAAANTPPPGVRIPDNLMRSYEATRDRHERGDRS